MSARVWYTSDLHFGHKKCATFRGFETTEEHDRALMRTWNDTVGPGDTVWVLGDVALGKGSLRWVGLLNGTKHLIAGNHDTCWPGHREAHKQQWKYLDYFASVQPFARRRVDGTEFLLSHFPYVADHHETSRYLQYRLRDDGLPLVHGHTHSAEIYNRERPRQIHVGWDAWHKPVDQEQVVELVREVTPKPRVPMPARPERVCECC